MAALVTETMGGLRRLTARVPTGWSEVVVRGGPVAWRLSASDVFHPNLTASTIGVVSEATAEEVAATAVRARALTMAEYQAISPIFVTHQLGPAVVWSDRFVVVSEGAPWQLRQWHVLVDGEAREMVHGVVTGWNDPEFSTTATSMLKSLTWNEDPLLRSRISSV